MTREPALNQSAHLSDDALGDLLLDAGSPLDASHVASCEVCSARVKMFQSSMSLFNQASSAWSEAKSHSISRELGLRPSRFAILPAWSIAAAFFFAVALSFLVGIHHVISLGGTASVAPAQGAAGQEVDRQQEIASDNAMLHAIDSALSQPVSSPVEVDGVQKTSSSLARPRALREVRD